jgi:hypothetical protein
MTTKSMFAAYASKGDTQTGGPLRRLGAASAARQGDSRLLRQAALTSATDLPDQDLAEP